MKRFVNNHRYTKAELSRMPTISQGQFDNLQIEDLRHKPPVRVWLSRMRVEDGMPYNNQVTIEHCVDGRWINFEQYEG